MKTPEIIQAIETYQEPGAVSDFDPEDFPQNGTGDEWSGHVPGTMMVGAGIMFLGMPAGFNRLGHCEKMPITLFRDWEHASSVWPYDFFNVPVWKHRDKHGNTLVRGMVPRLNRPFLHVILGDHLDKISCLEVTAEDLERMDY